jgi:hypothetical protein
MAEKLKDAEDRLLESMFRSDPIEDGGFSRRVVMRIRRRLWVQRLALPVAIFIGAAVAITTQLVIAASKLLAIVPQGTLEIPMTWIPQMQIVILGAMLLGAAMLGVRMLEE